MAQRFALTGDIGEYQPLHISATGTVVPIGMAVSTTSATTIAPGLVTVTPTAMTNIMPGMLLNFANGTGTAEDVSVVSITATTFTAVFINSHSGAYTITSLRGAFLGTLVVCAIGTGVTLTLYNGSPNTLPVPGKIIGNISPAQGFSYNFNCAVDRGLFYTLTGTPGSYTLTYIDMSI